MLCVSIGGCNVVNQTPEVTNTPKATNTLKLGDIQSEFFDVNKKDLPTTEHVGSGAIIYEYDLKDGSIFRTWFYDTGEYYVKENIEYPIQCLSSYKIVE